MIRSDSCRRNVRLCRAASGGFLQRDLLVWAPISTPTSSTSYVTGQRTIYIVFDDDVNQSGQQAAEHLAHRLADTVSRLVAFCCRRTRSQLLLRRRRGCATVPVSAGGGTAMKFRVISIKTAAQVHTAPFRVVEQGLGPRGRLDQPLSGPGVCPATCQQEPLQLCAQPVAFRALVGRAFIIPATSPRQTLPNRPCSTTSDSSRASNRRRLRPPSTTAWLVPIAPSVTSSPMLSLSGRPRLPPGLPASQTAGPRPAQIRSQQTAYKGTQAHHRSSLR